MGMETEATPNHISFTGQEQLWLRYTVNHHQSCGNSRELQYRMVLQYTKISFYISLPPR